MNNSSKNFSENEYIDSVFSKKIYLIILLFTTLWVLLIFLAPFLMATGETGEKISSVIYLFFSKVCHQDDGRSFHMFGHILGVCSRCVWIYSGFFTGILSYPLIKKINNVKLPSVWFLIIPVVILGADVFADITGILKNTFFSRSVTGFIIGFTLVFFLYPGFLKFFYEVNLFLKNKLST
ncbi:MAG TPA: DUF2085 domain-containing protein [Ignavibacteria bacterium]|nr:DUF2085 domain-containing protein [Ignavibacteria bacterium]HMR41349.1 DUF2085 domain-containing protein [Ignavibacteria bacterium]